MTVITQNPNEPGNTTWRKRYEATFNRLDPQMQAAKSSTPVQITAGASIAALLLTGRPLTAVALGAAWIGSQPLTRVAAAGVACAGVLNDAAKRAIVKMRGPANSTPGGRKPSKARRRQVKAKVSLAPAAG
jgi:hypothetical protein